MYEVTFIRRPKNAIELQEILAALLVKEIDSKYMYSFRSARIEVESKESIPWTLDGEFGGTHDYAVISNNPRAVEIRVTNECRKSITCEKNLAIQQADHI